MRKAVIPYIQNTLTKTGRNPCINHATASSVYIPGKLPIVTSFDVNAGHLQIEVQAGGAIVSCKAVSSNQSHAGTGPKPRRRSQSLNPLFLCDQNGAPIPTGCSSALSTYQVFRSQHGSHPAGRKRAGTGHPIPTFPHREP